MRLNVSSYRSVLGNKGLTDDQVCKSTGLSPKTLFWILENQYIEVSTLELVANALGVSSGEIALPDSDGCMENVIEWTKGQGRATLTLSQRRTITKVKRLAEKHPEECQVVAENPDGSICAHVPVSWIKISPPAARTEKQIETARHAMRNLNLKRGSVAHNLQ